MTRRLVSVGILVVGCASIAWSQAPPAPAPAAGPDPANFTGKVTGHPATDIRTLRYSFEPGARTKWHSHAGGQVVFVEQGHARVQERGGPIREFAPRTAYTAAPGVTHWHGAMPTEALMQVALSFGATTWMEPVTDAQYAGTAK